MLIRRFNWDLAVMEYYFPVEIKYSFSNPELRLNDGTNQFSIKIDDSGNFVLENVGVKVFWKYDRTNDRINIYANKVKLGPDNFSYEFALASNRLEIWRRSTSLGNVHILDIDASTSTVRVTNVGALWTNLVLGSNLNANNYKITNLADPSAEQDAVNLRTLRSRVFVVPDDGTLADAITWSQNNGGGIILLKPGTHTVPMYTTIPEHTVFIGVDRESTIITNETDQSGSLFYLNDNVAFFNLTIDTSAATNNILPLDGSSDNLIIKNCKILSNYVAVKTGGSDILIENSILRSHYNQINLQINGTRARIIGNTFYNGYFAIGHTSGSLSDSIIAFNKILPEDPANGLVIQDGTWFGGDSSNLRIIGNYYYTRDIGIRIYGSRIEIANNVFVRFSASGQTGLTGIILVDTTNSIVQGNVIENYTNGGIKELNSSANSDYNIIANNRVIGGGIITVGANTILVGNLVS